MRKCNQMKCGYNVMGGCRKCKVCGAEPNIINENCDACWNCENDEGILRWDESYGEETEEQAQKEEDKKQEILVKAK